MDPDATDNPAAPADSEPNFLGGAAVGLFVLLLLGAVRPEPLPPDEMAALRDGIPSLEERINLLYTHGVKTGKIDLHTAAMQEALAGLAGGLSPDLLSSSRPRIAMQAHAECAVIWLQRCNLETRADLVLPGGRILMVIPGCMADMTWILRLRRRRRLNSV